MADAVMSDTKTAYNNFADARKVGLAAGSNLVSNMEFGGQLGYSIKPGALDAATPFLMPPAVIYVTHTPRMWDVIPKAQPLARVVKALFETHAKSVTGIDLNYNLDTQGSIVGKDGQEMVAPGLLKRAAVNPNFTWGEVTGNLVWRSIETWLWDMCDPDTNIGLSRVPESELMPYTMSSYSLSFMALQFDQTMAATRLVDAVYITNVFPQATNEFGLKREIGQVSMNDRSISFTGIALHNNMVYTLGQTVAAQLGLRKANGTGTFNNNYGTPYEVATDIKSDNIDATSIVGIRADATKLSSLAGTEFPAKTPAVDKFLGGDK